MELSTIIACNLFGIILLLVILMNGNQKRWFRDIESRLFYAMVFVTMLGCLFEMTSFIVDGKTFPGAKAINIFCNTYVYVSNIVYPEIWLLFVEWKMFNNIERLKTAFLYASIPVATLGVLLVGNIRTQMIFTIDSGNVYSRGPLWWLFLGFPSIYIAISVGLVHISKRENNCHVFPIWHFIIPVIIGGIAQGRFFGISVMWCSVSVALAVVYMAKQREVSYVDGLSKIYNRKYMSIILEDCENKKNSISGIMIDIDRFKNINDTYGHQVGDEAIRDTGNIIKRAISDGAVATRYAGDEFVVLLQTNDRKEIEKTIGNIRLTLEEYNEEQPLGFMLDFSMGYSVYKPSNNTIDQFLKEMDHNMYAEKRIKKRTGWSSVV